ncbi:MAG: prepilin-type N-terminal cleavage/methylation domain-containing protein [Candidatus Thiodiazotropha sp. (ex Monitilora ramsayi)]|nr:prepilin-type N-terminal cleavage/methylation domain-containing protein [Candidatus Thiodiazotropha sp. (ex Monitilora ramsayi)]
MKKSLSGFTLVELMVAMAVLVIVITIGYPLYNQQLEKGRRVDAKGGLAKLAMAQERHYAMFGAYATTIAQLNFGPDGVEDGTDDTYAYREAVSDIDHDNDGVPDHYNIVLATDGDATTQDYSFTATAIDTQFDDEDCRTYTINQIGVKSAANSSGDDESERCW